MGEELGELGRRPRQGERGPFPRTVWLPEGHRQFSAMHVAASRGGGGYVAWFRAVGSVEGALGQQGPVLTVALVLSPLC